MKGFHVLVFEKDISTIRGEGQYRGLIQIQSNALAALEAIDPQVAEQVMEAGCITRDRINGLVDGISGTWYLVDCSFWLVTPVSEHTACSYLFWSIMDWGTIEMDKISMAMICT